MAGHDVGHLIARRSFLSKFAIGVTAGSATTGETARAAQMQSAGGDRWQPTRHAMDDWLDQIPGKHRFVIDTMTPDGFGNGLAFLNNYFKVNQSAYGLQDKDVAVVLIARHRATLFAYKDPFWAKYGALVQQITNFKFNDPKTQQPPVINVFNAEGYGAMLTNLGWTLESLLNRGVRVGVCQVSTRGYATAIANASGKNADAIYDELVGNLVSRAHMVPAGITAVNRAQERGYSLASAG
jgi:intracellular sulfur oxidation DsrE/DsrF family protein